MKSSQLSRWCSTPQINLLTWWTKQRRAHYWKDAALTGSKYEKENRLPCRLRDPRAFLLIKDPKAICQEINFDAASQLLEWVIAFCSHCHTSLPCSEGCLPPCHYPSLMHLNKCILDVRMHYYALSNTIEIKAQKKQVI